MRYIRNNAQHNKTRLPKFITFWFVCFVWFHPHINICFLLHFRVCLPLFILPLHRRRWANIDYDNKFLNRFESNSEPLEVEPSQRRESHITVGSFLSTSEIPMPQYVWVLRSCEIFHIKMPPSNCCESGCFDISDFNSIPSHVSWSSTKKSVVRSPSNFLEYMAIHFMILPTHCFVSATVSRLCRWDNNKAFFIFYCGIRHSVNLFFLAPLFASLAKRTSTKLKSM